METLRSPSKAFPFFTSKVSKTTDAHKSNVAGWATLLKEFGNKLEWAAGEGPDYYIELVDLPVFLNFLL